MRVVRGPVLAGLCIVSLAISFAAAVAPASALQDERLDVFFDFSPEQASFAPGENFTVIFTVTNAKLNSTVYPDELKITNVSAYFSWMGTNERVYQDVSGTSLWLEPGEFQIFSLNLSVPENATERTYTYKLWVGFWDNTAWGIDYENEWASDPYHDFIVANPTPNPPAGDEKIDYLPFVAIAGVLIVGAAGVTAYYMRKSRKIAKKPESAAGVQALGMAEAPATSSSELPVIRAGPGERFPIERGFVYLVKEKRPSIAFAMFNEAVSHGAKGMLVVREHPNRLKQMHEFEASKILWLTRRVGEDHIDPTELSLLSMHISKFIEVTSKSVVLLEGLEYLITQNNFETVLRFVNHLHDFVLAHDCAIIIVLDPRVLSTREIALLERSARIVEPGDYGVVKPDRLSETVVAK